jgi:hypothetical protein
MLIYICLYICVCVCMYVCIYMIWYVNLEYTHAHTQKCLYIYIYMFICVCIYVYVCVYLYDIFIYVLYRLLFAHQTTSCGLGINLKFTLKIIWNLEPNLNLKSTTTLNLPLKTMWKLEANLNLKSKTNLNLPSKIIWNLEPNNHDASVSASMERYKNFIITNLTRNNI